MRHDPVRMWRDAISLYDQGQYDKARALLNALQLQKPDDPRLRHLLAICNFRLGETAHTVADLQSLVVENPELALARVDCATILIETGEIEKAILLLREGHGLYPDDPLIGLNLCIAYAQTGDWEAFDHLSSILIQRHPAPELLWLRALTCLSYRHFAEGWADYRIRWRLPPNVWNSPRYDLGLIPVAPGTKPDKPFWLWTEQGLGDEILLASVIADARKAGLNFVFGCNPRNISIFRRRFPDLRIVDVTRMRRTDLGEIRLQMPLADLTALMRPDESSFTATEPYLLADPGLKERLRQKYLAHAPGNLLVGISWHSGKAARARQKSTALPDWAPILRLPGITFVNLQYGESQPALAEIRDTLGIEILHDSSINPLGPTDAAAAQIAALDFVITVSNTAAHVAGALGVPGLVMLPATYGLQWYWFRDTTRSLWYESLTLLRQDKAGNWQSVLAEAKNRLEEFARARQ